MNAVVGSNNAVANPMTYRLESDETGQAWELGETIGKSSTAKVCFFPLHFAHNVQSVLVNSLFLISVVEFFFFLDSLN